MSVLIASFVDGGKTLFMGADSRSCVEIDGVRYQDNDTTTKLFDNNDGLIFYCSGIVQMSNEVAETLLNSDSIDNNFILHTLKSVYTKHVKQYPKIANIRHALQFVIPNKCEDGTWEIVYIDSQNNFEPQIYAQNPEQNHFVFAIGTGGKIIHPIIDRGLGESGQVNVVSLYQKAFSAGTSEECGGTLTVIGFIGDTILNKQLPITDCREIRRHIKHAAGDGVITTPDGRSVSGVASITKPNKYWNFIYRNSNYAQERRLIFQDEGVELSTETGDIVVGHDNGSYVRLKQNGDIEIFSTGKVHISGNEYLFE